MWIFGRKGKSVFSACSTAEEVTKGIDATGLTAIVTGVTSGIGAETSRIFALHSVHVVMAVRNTESGEKVKKAILEEIPDAKIDVMELDLSSMASVRKFAGNYKSLGVMACPFTLSQDNIELQFATNHLGHFLLTILLLEPMKSTSQESHIEGRIVNVSSLGHNYTYKEGIHFHNISDESCYTAWSSYGQSKLANILHANELAKYFKEEGVNISANLMRHLGYINDFFN